MFCPNCGNNCGAYKFCTQCGTKLPEVVQSEVQSKETICPHCGATTLSGDTCPSCGARLIADVPNQEYSEILMGTYDGEATAKLTLEEDSIIVWQWFVFKTYVQRINYDQLVHVRYIRGSRKKVGFLAIRWEGNQDLPFPTTFSGYCADKTTVRFSYRYNMDFYQIYRFLHTKAPQSTQFSMYNSV